MSNNLIGTKPFQVPTNADLGRLAFQDFVGLSDVGAAAPTISSAGVISPLTQIVFVSGTVTINTINPPPSFLNGGQITIIPTGKFKFSTTDNIKVAVTAEVSKPIYLTYVVDSVNGNKWYPSYSDTYNRVTITAPSTSSVLTIEDNKTFTVKNSLTLTGVDSKQLTVNKNITLDGNDDKTLTLNASVTLNTTGNNAVTLALATGGTVTFTSNKLSVFSATTSAELAGVISDETGTGNLVFGTSPNILTSLTTTSTSFDLITTSANIVNFANAATTLSIGAVNSNTTINGNLTVNGVTELNASSLSIDDKNIELGAVEVVTPTCKVSASSASVTNLSSIANIIIGSTVTAISAGTVTLPVSPITTVIAINGTTITLSQSLGGTGLNVNGTITFSGPSNTTATGGGITLKAGSDGDKTIIWDSTNSNWTSSENWNIASGKAYKINNVSVLSTPSDTSVTIGGTATTVTIASTGTAAQTVNMFTASTGASTYNFATGPTLDNTTKTINIGTGGVNTSITAINIGAASDKSTNVTTVNNTLKVLVGGNTYTVGYVDVPQNAQSVSYAPVLTDIGKHIYHNSIDPHTYNITSGRFSVGAVLMFVNKGLASITIKCDTAVLPIVQEILYQSITGNTGDRTLAPFGVSTVLKITATEWIISGTGLS